MNRRTIAERLAALSPDARALLARRLNLPENDTRREQLVVFYETADGAPVAAGELRRLLLDRLPHFMVPARFELMAALPTLPNGKIDRHALSARREPSLSMGALGSPAGAKSPAESGLDEDTSRLLTIWRDVLGPSVGPRDDFFEAGGDSIAAMRLISKAATAGFTISLTEFFRAPTVTGMLTAARPHAAKIATLRPPAQQNWTPVPLTPIQHWFFEQEFAGIDRWNQARLFEIPRELKHERVEAALHSVIANHEAFRLAFVRKAGGWQQQVQPIGEPAAIARVSVCGTDHGSRDGALEHEAATLQAAMRLDSGLLLRAVRLTFPEQPLAADLLCIIGHHLSLDLVSWDILLGDLEAAYRQLESDLPVRLASVTSFSEWCARLSAYAQSPDVRAERFWWSMASHAFVPPLPHDLADVGPNDEASADVVSVGVSGESTERLLNAARLASRGSLSDYVLAGLVHALAAWSGSTAFRIGMEGHGRAGLGSGMDVSRTIGWFTSYWPLTLDVSKDRSLSGVLRTVKERLGLVPGDGTGYGLLRYLTLDDALTRELASAPPPEVVFNYVGRQRPATSEDRMFRPVAGTVGSRDPRARRASVLEVSARIVDGRLQLACVYSRNVHRGQTIENLMHRVADNVAAFADSVPGSPGRVASEFPDAGLSQDELNGLID